SAALGEYRHRYRFDGLIHGGLDQEAALGKLKKEAGKEHGPLLEALENVKVPSAGRFVKAVGVKDLVAGMILDQDLHASNGLLLVTRNQEITLPLIERLRRFADGVGVEEPFRVLVDRSF
ncbi:MAG: hypothetical protein ACE5ID_08365, partial [Acidobacteriota bacterium]